METPSVDPRVSRTRADVLAAAGAILLAEGWAAVTHARVAERAGYSKVTLYSHWPQPVDLLREAFAYVGKMPHHTPTGALRSDLAGELSTFNDVLVNRGFARALAGLAERAHESGEIATLRDKVMADGAAPMRRMLAGQLAGAGREDVAVSLLLGAILYRTVMCGLEADDAFVRRTVDAVLAGLTKAGAAKRNC